MAAIVHLPAQHHPGTRPALRLVEGGRSPRSMVAVYRRRRLVAAVAALAVAVVLLVALATAVGAVGHVLGADAAAGRPAASATSTGTGSVGVVVVQSGDTLTAIARRLQPTGDISGLIDRLAAIHGPGPLMAGDRLAVGGLVRP